MGNTVEDIAARAHMLNPSASDWRITFRDGSAVESNQVIRESNQVIRERTLTHGEFRQQAEATDGIRRAIFANWVGEGGMDDPVITEGLGMICHKLGRIAAGDATFKDHWVDIAGYATLVAQMLDTREE